MGTRTFADVPPTAATIALNAYIYGYGGHSLVTPHHAIKQLWWTDDRIDAKVTREFIVSKLRAEERSFLHKPLAFGEGLTDDTYLDWILERARRLFLVLSDIGVPDQIFGCVDDSWDDDDLPVSLETVRGLGLSYDNNDNLNKKFYDTQFVYLLRELKEGSHIDYGANEHIPMDYANTVPPAVSLQIWDRVHFPGRPDEVYMRRKVSFSDKDAPRNVRSSFMRDVKRAQSLTHHHIARAWGSYTAKDAGYVLSDLVGEHTLATFMSHRMPPQFVRVPVQDRPVMVCEWMHCLADAVACLHHRGIAHGAIRPSNIILDDQNRIAFSDVGTLRTLQQNKKLQNKTETYDYAAPESSVARSAGSTVSSPTTSASPTFARFPKPASISGSSVYSSNSSGDRSSILSDSPLAAGAPLSPSRSNSVITITATIGNGRSDSGIDGSARNLGRRIVKPFGQPSPTHLAPIARSQLQVNVSHNTTPTSEPMKLAALPTASPLQSDIFSLGCVFLDIVTFVIKGRLGDFVKFRTTKVKPLKLPGAPKIPSRIDSSFHYDPDKIYRWMSLLEEEAASKAADHPVFHGVPILLLLIRKMMAQNPALRPNALEVRDSILEILVRRSFIDRALCCADREWDYIDFPLEENEAEEDLALAPTASAPRVTHNANVDESPIDETSPTTHEPLFSKNASAPLTDLPITDLPGRPRTASTILVSPPPRSSSLWPTFGRKVHFQDSKESTMQHAVLEDGSDGESVLYEHGLKREGSNASVRMSARGGTERRRGVWKLGFGRKG